MRVLALLLGVRLLVAPWGDILVFNNTIDFMCEAKLSVGQLVMGHYGDVHWPQPGAYPLLLK